jgi:hypothetical protein|tara:strand:+ start:249 stop:488 length:240 start_codon:yes stop_codon:yes gene_type:complete
MIDTDKYEGHYKGSWANQYGDVVKLVYPNESSPSLDADQRLIIDAPLLLAEVKRFNEMKKWLLENHTQVMLQYTYGRVD